MAIMNMGGEEMQWLVRRFRSELRPIALVTAYVSLTRHFHSHTFPTVPLSIMQNIDGNRVNGRKRLEG